MVSAEPRSSTRAARTATRARGGARLLAVLLLVASAVTGLQAAWSRWALCYVDADPPVSGLPEGRAAACEALQDHLYDYGLPSEPWVPIADAAQREGLSLLALGLAIVLVAVTVMVSDRWSVRVVSAALGAIVGAMWLSVGAATLLSGLAGEPVEPGLPAGVLAPLIFLGPLVTLGLAIHAAGRRTGVGLLVGLFWVAMTVAQPLPEFFLTLMVWSSYDSSPLEGFARCAVVAVAAVAVAATLLPTARRPALLRRLQTG